MLKLSPTDIRRLVLYAQGLHKVAAFGTSKGGVQRCISQLGYIQIDTISVIKRAHHHTCWTRVPDYQVTILDDLQKAKLIFEYWAHAAAYLPMQDYRYCLPRMQAIAGGEKHWHKPQHKLMRSVLDRIRAEGPLQAKDFASPNRRNPGGWWQWTPAKRALEQLFIQGQLIVSHRSGFQKVYDLPERVLPADMDTSVPTPEEFRRFLILSSIRSHGLASDAEIGYLRKGMKKTIAATLADMVDAGEIVSVTLPGATGKVYSTMETLERTNIRIARQVRLLSPFDNLVIQRKRLQDIFRFDYQLECYVPAARRKYGYYCLPVLYGTELVGRLDPKAEHRTGILAIRNLALEQGVKVDEKFAALLAERLAALAAFNDCHRLVIESCNSKPLKQLLARELPLLDAGKH